MTAKVCGHKMCGLKYFLYKILQKTNTSKNPCRYHCALGQPVFFWDVSESATFRFEISETTLSIHI